MVAIPGGTFMMGAPENEKDSFDYERPQHQVTVQPFFMGKYPVLKRSGEP
jgi:formylglycine-generating enzyme required for sulfatase activity